MRARCPSQSLICNPDVSKTRQRRSRGVQLPALMGFVRPLAGTQFVPTLRVLFEERYADARREWVQRVWRSAFVVASSNRESLARSRYVPTSMFVSRRWVSHTTRAACQRRSGLATTTTACGPLAARSTCPQAACQRGRTTKMRTSRMGRIESAGE